jgi:hypothetical protein
VIFHIRLPSLYREDKCFHLSSHEDTTSPPSLLAGNADKLYGGKTLNLSVSLGDLDRLSRISARLLSEPEGAACKTEVRAHIELSACRRLATGLVASSTTGARRRGEFSPAALLALLEAVENDPLPLAVASADEGGIVYLGDVLRSDVDVCWCVENSSAGDKSQVVGGQEGECEKTGCELRSIN